MMARSRSDPLLLGEWACLGVLYAGPSHGFAIAGELKPDGELGRIWSMSRALTYRALDQLSAAGLIHSVGEEPGIAGGNRTVLAITRSGRSRFRDWVTTPVEHLRDLRSELLLKIVLAERCSIDIAEMLEQQRHRVAAAAAAFDHNTGDVVDLWRTEFAYGALAFLDRVIDGADDPTVS